MVKRCVLKACKTRYASKEHGVMLHKFPKPGAGDRLKAWEKFVNRSNRTTTFQAYGGALLCSGHFEPTCYMSDRLLVRDAVPTIAPEYTKELAFKHGLIQCLDDDVPELPPDFPDSAVTEECIADSNTIHLTSGSAETEECVDDPDIVQVISGNRNLEECLKAQKIIVTPDNTLVEGCLDDAEILYVIPDGENNDEQRISDTVSVTENACDELMDCQPVERSEVLGDIINLPTPSMRTISSAKVHLIEASPSDCKPAGQGSAVKLHKSSPAEPQTPKNPKFEPQTPEMSKFLTPIAAASSAKVGDNRTPQNAGDVAGTSTRDEFLTPKTDKTVRYVGDLSPRDFATPRRSKKHLNFMKEAIGSVKHKLKMSQQRLRRAHKKITDLKSLLKHVKAENKISEEVSTLIDVYTTL